MELDRSLVQHLHRLEEHHLLGRKQRSDFHFSEVLVVESEQLAFLDRSLAFCEASCAARLVLVLRNMLHLLSMGHHLQKEVSSRPTLLAHPVVA